MLTLTLTLLFISTFDTMMRSSFFRQGGSIGQDALKPGGDTE